ncbi:hypothetical protein BU23DRAFT_554016 [Bimuria novae-zelandiae CBS 107.79]|uniref:Uncharacterized protein n=1 Tax=Bimuria novae-zelandiae CBS 107.79 TaxID=1447943 RepID=A0A6A5VF97_9PLEO|nr:hypothetical protein BU23DRAFT_554016 [Bimuria novae-zelandiae CBS 107.79]
MEVISRKGYDMFTKSSIPSLFKRYATPMDPLPYQIAANVFPMRVNNHIAGDIIDWSNVPDDPIFQLAFPQPGMLMPNDLATMSKAADLGMSKAGLQHLAEEIRAKMNPHPAN